MYINVCYQFFFTCGCVYYAKLMRDICRSVSLWPLNLYASTLYAGILNEHQLLDQMHSNYICVHIHLDFLNLDSNLFAVRRRLG